MFKVVYEAAVVSYGKVRECGSPEKSIVHKSAVHGRKLTSSEKLIAEKVAS